MHHQFTPHRYKTIAEMDHNEKGYIRPSSIVWSYADSTKKDIIYALFHHNSYSTSPDDLLNLGFDPDSYTVPISCYISDGEKYYSIGEVTAEYTNLNDCEDEDYIVLARVMTQSKNDLFSILNVNPEQPLYTTISDIITIITQGDIQDDEEEIIEDLISELTHQDIYTYKDTCTILSWIETFYRTNTIDEFFDECAMDNNIQNCLYRLLDKSPTGIYQWTYQNINQNPSFQSQLLDLKALYTEDTHCIDTTSQPTQPILSEFERLQSELEQAYQEHNNKKRVSLLQSAQQALKVAVEQEDYELAEQYKKLINIYKFSIS